MNTFKISGNVVDAFQQKIYAAVLSVGEGRIESIKMIQDSVDNGLPYILPGFVDSHVHIESSMLVPAEFAKLAVVHGTVATVSDPHEIANVCGMKGVQFMIDNGGTVNFKFNFGAPSCVPATIFETAGASLNNEEVEELIMKKEIRYLSEMMNFPGVINDDGEVMQKIEAAKRAWKPIDGHAPALRGEALVKYIGAGISTDHECFTKDEALEKLSLGMKILIREGSAAKNFDALIDLLHDYPDEIMFCSDDKHPDSLAKSHINELCRRSVNLGIDLFKIIKAACINPVLHYSLDVGLLRPGDPADFVISNDLASFVVEKTFINGVCVADNGKSLIKTTRGEIINNFDALAVNADQIKCSVKDIVIEGRLPVIVALDNQLVTKRIDVDPNVVSGYVESDVANDILKIVVINRYKNATPAIGFIKNFGLKKGAIASSVAHDSHNIIATGVDDASIAGAVNLIISEKGGISIYSDEVKEVLSLPIAGLMSDADGYQVARDYTKMDLMAKENGSTLSAPFMTLSFMALLVIPSLKLSDKGLFDGDSFSFVYR